MPTNSRAAVNPALLTFSIVIGPACSSLQPTEASPEEIGRLITAEDLLKPGDRVRLVTADEAVHEFRIDEIDLAQGLVAGEGNSIPIVSIVAVETRKISVGRTAVLTGGLTIGIAMIIAIAIAPAIILGGG
jgi:hypothetical protein